MSKRNQPIRAIFDNLSSLTSEDILSSDIFKQLVKSETPAAIERAMQEKKAYATLFEINNTASYIDIPKRNWQSALESCLQWYIEDEDFDKCIHIKDLIKKIQEKKPINIPKD